MTALATPYGANENSRTPENSESESEESLRELLPTPHATEGSHQTSLRVPCAAKLILGLVAPLALCCLAHKTNLMAARTGYEDYRMSLHSAAKHGRADVVKVLLEKGAEKDAKDVNQQTPLHIAAQFGFEDVVKVLLEEGAEMGAKDVKERTPLHLAAYHGREDVVKVLLEKGADKDAKDVNHHTPLHYAMEKGHRDVVELLQAEGGRV